jgi:uncharacterized protein (DUF2249 family)
VHLKCIFNRSTDPGTTTMTTAFATPIDVRAIAPRERHPLIFASFRGLPPGQAMELVNDHDPRGLHEQFRAEMPAQFTWDDLESGPDTWRVRITRLAPAPSSGKCCGCCGGE